MKKYFNWINILLLVLVLSNSCSKPQLLTAKYTEIFRIPLSNLSADSNIYNEIIFKHKLCHINDSTCLYYYNGTSLIYHNVTSAKTTVLTLNKVINTPIDYLLYKENTLAFLYDKYILLFNYKTNDTSRLIFDFPKNQQVTPEEIVVQSLPNYDFTYLNNKFYIPLSYKLWVNDEEKIKFYYSLPLTLSVQENNSQCNFLGTWPKNYLKGNYYGDFFYYLTEGAKESLIYSFRSSENILVYNSNNNKSFQGSYKNCENFTPYPLKDVQNFSNLKKYNIESPRFGQILYNPENDFYYRIYKPECKYYNENNEFKQANEIGWKILVLNERFEAIGEHSADPHKYSFYKVFCDKGKLWVINEVEDLIKRKEIIYTQIDIQVNK